MADPAYMMSGHCGRLSINGVMPACLHAMLSSVIRFLRDFLRACVRACGRVDVVALYVFVLGMLLLAHTISPSTWTVTVQVMMTRLSMDHASTLLHHVYES